jgi:ribosome-binding ATPase YchF (GTP1/OBG family)
VDIAGLVRGASKGEGLGNQFLANIREVDAIAHVVRCFEDPDITHVEGKIDPLADIETIETELMLADLDSLEKRVVALEKRARGGDKEAKESLDLVNRSLTLLREGRPARLVEVKPEERRAFDMLGLLTSKPVLYVCNVEEASAEQGERLLRAGGRARPRRGRPGRGGLGQDRERDRGAAARRAEGLPGGRGPRGARPKPGDPRRLQALGLVTYFTVGPKEARAWTITVGTRAPQAAGVIHTDFEKGFIRAETIAYPTTCR